MFSSLLKKRRQNQVYSTKLEKHRATLMEKGCALHREKNKELLKLGALATCTKRWSELKGERGLFSLYQEEYQTTLKIRIEK